MDKIIILLLVIFSLIGCKDNQVNASLTEQPKMKIEEELSEIFPEPKVKIKTVGILMYDGFANLDAIGPYAVFTSLMETDVFFVGMHKGLVKDARGMKVQVDTTINDVKKLDILIIPGGFKETYDLTKNEKLLHWIRSIDSTSTYTASVCTGAWILGATGLLQDKKATTHWYGKKLLEENYGAKIQNTRYTHSGKYWTSAGVTAGMDMSLAMLKEIAGENYTKVVMLDLEYDPKPPIKGGSVTNTDKRIVNALRGMYDSGMQTVLNPEEKNLNIKTDNKKDPVCKMNITNNVSDTIHYKQQILGFCSSTCKDLFKKNPSSFSTKK